MNTSSPKPSRWLTAAAAILALAMLAPSQGPRVSAVSGAVEIGVGQPPTWKAARGGDAITPGDAVRTGPGASAELVLGTRTVRLYENSVLRIPTETAGRNGPRAVELESGRSLFDVLKRGDGDRFDVRTPEVVVSVKGTRFLVDAGDANAPAAVSVFRGEVGVRALAQQLSHEVRVRPGFTAFGGGGRVLELGLTAHDDPWQAWSKGKPAPGRSGGPATTGGAAALPPAKAATRDARKAAGEAAEKALRDQGVRIGPERPARRGGPPVVNPKGAGDKIQQVPAEMAPISDAMQPGIPTLPIEPSSPVFPGTPGGSIDGALKRDPGLLHDPGITGATGTLGTP